MDSHSILPGTTWTKYSFKKKKNVWITPKHVRTLPLPKKIVILLQFSDRFLIGTIIGTQVTMEINSRWGQISQINNEWILPQSVILLKHNSTSTKETNKKVNFKLIQQMTIISAKVILPRAKRSPRAVWKADSPQDCRNRWACSEVRGCSRGVS